MNKWIAEFDLEDGDTMPEHMDLEYKGARIDFHCRPLEQELCEDVISRKSIKQKLQEHHDFFVEAYAGFSNLPQNDKSRVDEITNCIAMVVNEPPVILQEPQSFKWCTDCREYDQENHCCHRWSKVIRDTVEDLKQELEPIIEKIRAEIEQDAFKDVNGSKFIFVNRVNQIIDKYRAETEDTK